MFTQTAPLPRPRPLASALQSIGTRGFACAALAAIPGLAQAELPSGGTVAGGAASIANLDANHQRITQTTDRAIINWQTFSIGASDYVQFIQPSTASVALNRITGGTPSSILGSLSANGQVFLVNPNGVYFGPGAQIDVAGLVATTLAIGDADFMAGRYVFARDPAAPARAEVINQGVIAAREGGYVVLAGDYAANSGAIQARLGTIALAAGNTLTLDLAGDRLVSFAVDEKTVAQLAGVANTGQLMADGGRIFMTAKVAGDLAAMVVNNDGLVQARSTVERNGEIYLTADGGGIHVGGTLDASAQPGAGGGHVSVVSQGGGDTVLTNGSLIKVSGSDLAVSNAGSVYAWADATTRFEKGALIEARGGASGGDGGFVEISGREVKYRGLVDARAPHGRIGSVLLDPIQITIANGLGADNSVASHRTIYETYLEDQLQLANVNLVATGNNASITMENLTADGVLDGRNGGAGGSLTLGITSASGTPRIEFVDPGDTIAVDGDLYVGNYGNNGAAGSGTKPDIAIGNLIGRNVSLNGANVAVGAITASNAAGAARVLISGEYGVALNGAVTLTANSSANDGAQLEVLATGGNISHTAGHIQVTNNGNGGAIACFSNFNTCGTSFGGSPRSISLGQVTTTAGSGYSRIMVYGNNAITVNDNLQASGRSANIVLRTATSGSGISLATGKTIAALAGPGNATVSINSGNSSSPVILNGTVRANATGSSSASIQINGGNVTTHTLEAISSNGRAQITISGDDGVTLAGPVTVRGQGSGWSGTGAKLEVRAGNGNIGHTAGTIEVTNTNGSGGAIAYFMAGNVGNCSGSGSPSGNARTITLQNVVVTSDTSSGSGWAKIGVNATGGIALQDDVTVQGRYAASVGLYTQNGSASIALADASKTIKANMTDVSSGSGAQMEIYAYNSGTVDFAGAVAAYANGAAQASIDIQGGTVTVGEIDAGNATPAANPHRAQVNIQSQLGDITLNGPITVTGNSNSGSGAYLFIQSANNLDHSAGSATAIHVRNYLGSNGGAYAEMRATGTATVGKASVQGYEGAELNISALGGISVVDDVTVTADGGGARVNLYRGSGSPGSIPISLAAGKTIRAIATGSPGGGAYVDINGNGGGAGGVISINGSLIAEGGAGLSSGQANISVSGGDVTLGSVTATAGNSAQISITGINITLNSDLTAATSIQLSPNYNSFAGDIAGNGHNLLTSLVQIRGGVGAGAFDVTTNAASIDVQGGGSLTVNAAAQAGTLTAVLGGSSSNQAVGNISITTAGALNFTQLWTTGATHLLRADTLTLPGSITMPAGAAVTLKPYTLTNTVGAYSATDTDATINTNYSAAQLNLFPAGATLTIGGATGGQQTGNIHVGADGAFDIGDKNIVFDTSGSVVTHNAPTTTGTVTVLVPVVPVVPPPPPPPAATESAVEPEVSATFTSVASNPDNSSAGDSPAGDNPVGRNLAGLFQVGGAGYSPPPSLFVFSED